MSGSAKPRVVVGITTRNRVSLLEKAIESAFAQSYQPLRLAVIDDASTDETPNLRARFPAATWERRESPEGYVRARNAMMLNCSEDYYVSLDDDAWFLDRDEVSLAVDLLEREPKTAAVAFDILSPDRPARQARGGVAAVAVFIGCGHVLRVSAVRELGGYIEFPGTYGSEEKDLCLQLLDVGYATVLLEGVHVWHSRTSLARDIPRQHRSAVCNDLSLALRRTPLPMLIPVLAWKILRQLYFALRHGFMRPFLRGIGDFARGLPPTWRSRKPVSSATLLRFRALASQSRRTARPKT